MCSNNITSNNVGVRGNVGNGASGVVGDHGDYESSCLRKAKKQRIPKRGPGVAELEKILREQEKKDGQHVEKGKLNIGGISSLPNTYRPPPPPHYSFASSSNSLPRSVTNFLGNSPSTTPPPPDPVTVPGGNFHVNDGNGNGNLKGSSQLGCGDMGGNGRSKGVYIGGSGIFLPEQTLLPITWGSSETRKGEEPSKMATDFSFPILLSNGSDHAKMFPSPMLQKNHGPCHPSMMIDAKRLRPNNFTVDNWPPAPPHMPSSQPLPFHPHISRLDPASSSNKHGHVFSLGTASRDPIPTTSPLELKAKTYVGYGSALITLGSPTTPLPSTQNCQPDFSKFIKQFPFQEMKENNEELLFQRSSLSESEVSVQKKSFFSFLLQPEEQKGASATQPTLVLKNEKYCTEKTGDFIDLNLKL
ncbi:hypothetical protein REPUB_Repub14bG0117700 [Reevesia pubescens]